LEDAEKQICSNFFDMDGLPMAAYAGKATLVYPPALRGAVMRVCSERALERPDKTVRDINVYSGKYNLVEWDYLSSKMGGSDTAWFIIYPDLKNLKLIKHKAGYETAMWRQDEYQRYYFDAWLYAIGGAADWRGLFGSTGS
jgi:Zn/Cd-binding protein ZinT